MNLGKFFEEEIIVGHSVKNARRGKDHAVRGAKGGDQNSDRYDFSCPRPEHKTHGVGCNSVAHSGCRGTERNQIRNYCH